MNEEIKTYEEIVKHLSKTKRTKHLLMGNGFSMSYDPEIFSYNVLSKYIYNLEDEQLHRLFDILNTNNFELIMQQLENSAKISEIFGADNEVINSINEKCLVLKESLINAVKELHPDHVFQIPDEKSRACAEFLQSYLNEKGHVFSTNYDLLLYWVLLRNNLDKKGDGFGRDAEDTDSWVEPEDRSYSELRWGKNSSTQTIHFLHGALQIFDTGVDVIKEEYSSEHNLLDKVKSRMEKGEFPVFVTAGSSNDKLTQIMHNKYLAFCYEKLTTITGSLVCFGFGFGKYDEHIIAAINKANKLRDVDPEKNKRDRLHSIYIGVFSEKDIENVNSIMGKFKCKVNLFDAKTANVWG